MKRHLPGAHPDTMTEQRQPHSHDISERLHRAGLRITLTRVNIMRAVEGAPNPFTVEDIHQQLTGAGIIVSLGTIYRVLSGFEITGLISRHWASGIGVTKSTYSPMFPHAGQLQVPLHRLTCRRCGTSCTFQDVQLMLQLRQFSGWDNLDGDQHTLNLETETCASCQPVATADPARRPATAVRIRPTRDCPVAILAEEAER